MDTPEGYRDIVNLAVKKILRMNSRALEVLNTTPSCNLDVVRRTARDVRDPNPLATTLEYMSKKYSLFPREHTQALCHSGQSPYYKNSQDLFLKSSSEDQ
ncbi:hypothetical protein J6590_087353, partial [Homalodisca vitripennis]